MASSRSFSYGLLVCTVLVIFSNHASALNIEYCSSLNTASTQANSSIYQSNGLCYNFCVENWAFAILQESDCYCSNEAPGITTSVSDCNFQCPGYPNDLCGSSNGLFGYLALTKSPTATVGGSSATTSSTSQVSTPLFSSVASYLTTGSYSLHLMQCVPLLPSLANHFDFLRRTGNGDGNPLRHHCLSYPDSDPVIESFDFILCMLFSIFAVSLLRCISASDIESTFSANHGAGYEHDPICLDNFTTKLFTKLFSANNYLLVIDILMDSYARHIAGNSHRTTSNSHCDADGTSGFPKSNWGKEEE
ncbi:Cell wall integrity and stress response component 4 [Hyphodiscus hymeniophilus]|uniref:Cell wall integrity and stress response component 4 n=1 Tax=Hyphodiscus hymeniophilus TaxID=353542 RepID=A0A9P6VFJ2_9HELO|nr:Cell wall integrity and stress response component 4 [Hyphodiscus hymeniophilus]